MLQLLGTQTDGQREHLLPPEPQQLERLAAASRQQGVRQGLERGQRSGVRGQGQAAELLEARFCRGPEGSAHGV